jgi:ABC-type sugar transport system permease subunit
MNKTNIILPFLFLLPTFFLISFLISLFMFYPLFFSLVISFYDINPSNFQLTNFVGLKNYTEVIGSISFGSVKLSNTVSLPLYFSFYS